MWPSVSLLLLLFIILVLFSLVYFFYTITTTKTILFIYIYNIRPWPTSCHITLFQGTWAFRGGGSQFMDGQTSIATALKEAGYHTSTFGKWFVVILFCIFLYFFCRVAWKFLRKEKMNCCAHALEVLVRLSITTIPMQGNRRRSATKRRRFERQPRGIPQRDIV